jgi:hypothetical protein
MILLLAEIHIVLNYILIYVLLCTCLNGNGSEREHSREQDKSPVEIKLCPEFSKPLLQLVSPCKNYPVHKFEFINLETGMKTL